jgi:hypothetical protein
MGNTIFNTLLIKSATAEPIAEIKSSIIDINNEGNTEIVFSKLVPIPTGLDSFEHEHWSNENWGLTFDRWDAEFVSASEYLIVRFWTNSNTPSEWVRKISIQYPDQFFMLTSSSVYDGNCYTSMGRNGAMYYLSVPVFELDNNRQPFYYDSNGIERYFTTEEEVPLNMLGGRSFRNPFTLLIEVLVKGNCSFNF